MKKTLVLLFAIISLCSFTNADHETYLSVTEIEYKKEQKSLQIISRVFIDDFEDVLSKRYQKKISLSYKEDLISNKPLIEKYLAKKLNISVNGKELKLNFLGSKFDADQIVLFIESVNTENFSKIKVENLILTDLFDSQKNIVHVKKGEDIESMLLLKENSSKTINF
ncbi:DUF6702 family protein [Christiangramia sabulilitoris]|uniref:Peptidase E n=1 Tax=Christiangramia sabulilitoris TaxID=2583991 RepID=A0A550I3N7_9FLAO|nr:DUF6702 family protein [Christiangramia sabulilitoris]TRO65593.1 hypothetical protein FGM01_09345 [Christiangramia sabulilitoris]